MADTTFPPGLTRSPRVDSLGEQAPDVVIRSEVEVGPAKVRRRFSGDRRTFSIQLDLTRTELATFDTFFLTTTQGGALSFEWKHPRTASLADFRFLRPPTYRPRAPRGDGSEWWLVEFDVELLPGTDQSITPPGGGVDPHGGTWALLFPGSGSVVLDDDAEVELDEAIISGVFREPDSAAPDFVLDLLTRGYSYIPEDGEGDEGDEDSTSGTSVGKSSEASVSIDSPSIAVISLSGD